MSFILSLRGTIIRTRHCTNDGTISFVDVSVKDKDAKDTHTSFNNAELDCDLTEDIAKKKERARARSISASVVEQLSSIVSLMPARKSELEVINDDDCKRRDRREEEEEMCG